MDFKYKLFTQQCLACLLMVAPATANSNFSITSASIIDGIEKNGTEPVSVQINTEGQEWITHEGLHPNADALVNAIATSESHGLNIESYQLQSLKQELESFVENSEISGTYSAQSNAEQRVKLENSLNYAFELFAHDLGRGVLNARETQRGLHRSAPDVDTDALLARLRSGESTLRELLKELIPTTPYYQNLVNHMKVLLEERDTGIRRTKVSMVEDVTIGTEHESIIKLRSRLIETGDLDPNSRISNYFDEEVSQALIAVQERNGLDANGEITEATVVALNASVDDDIEQVAMNLERWRWMPRELGHQHILVNVPSYNLTMMSGDQRIADMAVVVGSKKHKTPIFSQDAEFVEVAPTWTVPASITNNELVPTELRRPGYLESQRMDFFRREGQRLKSVPRSQVTAADFQEKPFPYVIRQRAGAGNALGGIKILMPNKFAVYMHDTQAKKLFAKTDRAYSHGCIRLSDPFLIGSLLLQLDGKTEAETAAFLDRKKTKRVKLNTTTPTHISYFTAWVDDEGQLHKRKDVYNHNKTLLSGLHENNTLLSTLKSRPAGMLAEQADL